MFIFQILIILIFYYLYKTFGISLIKGIDNKVIIITLITIPFFSLQINLLSILLSKTFVTLYNKINILSKILNFILILVFIMIYKSPLSVLILNCISTFIILNINIYIVFVKFKYRIKRINICLLKKMLNYGLKVQFSNIIQFITYRLDVFIIGYLLTVKEIGLYSNAVSLAEIIWQIPNTISTILYPDISKENDIVIIKEFTNRLK